MVQMMLTVPAGVSAGQSFQFRTPDGRVMQTAVPAGVRSGGTFLVDIPMAQAPVPVAQAVPAPAPAPYGGAAPAGGGLDRCAAAMAGCSLSGGSEEAVPMGRPVTPEAPRTRTPPPAALADSMRSNPADRSAAERHAECPICFEPLHKAPVGVFLDRDGKRVSHHFYRLEAAREWIRSGNGTCPLTRAAVHSVLPVPDIRTDPDGWFRAVDLDGDRRLSRFEVVECLKAQLPVDNAALDAAVADAGHWMWQQWDVDGSGYIEQHELLQPQGLAAYVREAFRSNESGGRIPSIERDKGAWYDYWDEDRSGSLEQEEVVRALIKTLQLSTDQARVQLMRTTVEAIWPIFDSDGSGSIERDEFLLPNDGLADMILATIQHG